MRRPRTEGLQAGPALLVGMLVSGAGFAGKERGEVPGQPLPRYLRSTKVSLSLTQSFPIREQVAAVSGVSAQKKVSTTPTFSLRAERRAWALHRAVSSEVLPKKAQGLVASSMSWRTLQTEAGEWRDPVAAWTGERLSLSQLRLRAGFSSSYSVCRTPCISAFSIH